MQPLPKALSEQILFLHTILLAVLFHIRDSYYTPSGLRTMSTDALHGIQLTESLLLNEHPQRIQDLTRLKRETFIALLQWLTEKTNLKTSRNVSAAEKLLIFLFICSNGVTFRAVSETFQHSTRTVHRAFYEVLHCLLRLYKDVVLSPDQTPDKIRQDNNYWPYFMDCIGALDGGLIEAWVPGKDQAPWRSRDGTISQNILAACDFEMNFVYVLAGWEGSALDDRVLADARARGFHAPTGKYYVADGGYSNSDLTIIPYPNVRSHLRDSEQARDTQKPQNPEELFNLRHASLRHVIERTLGVFKQRFVILQKAPRQYSIETQVKLIYALVALHNFMNKHGHDPQAECQQLDSLEVDETEQCTQENDNVNMTGRRDEIANSMWKDYLSHLENTD
jgi:DDE superfamily endonuclease